MESGTYFTSGAHYSGAHGDRLAEDLQGRASIKKWKVHMSIKDGAIPRAAVDTLRHKYTNTPEGERAGEEERNPQ